uniref:Glabrous enhancer-binding protein-like DBD domain-containing protein n=1 Tax=Leersia perrieri TaxID=77586 RepID=A0A0D9VEY5_9ORYZ
MAKKRRAPSPPPPPPPEAESSDESSSGDEEDEGKDSPAAAPVPPQKKPSDHGAASSEGEEDDEEEVDSDTDTYAQGFQLRKVGGAPDDEEGEEVGEEEGGSSESEPEDPEPVKKKEAAKKSKSEEAKKKRAADEPAPSGKAKKAKGEKEAASPPPEPVPSGKSKKAVAKGAAVKKTAAAAAAAEPAPSGKAKKAKVEPDPSPSSKSGKAAVSRWTTADELKILDILVAHFKSHGTQLNVDGIISAAGDSLDRKGVKYSVMYEKVRSLKQRYEATAKKVAGGGALPAKEDDLRMYQLSSEIWGEDAKEAAAAALASQKNGTPAKSKKGQAKKDKVDGDSKEAATAVNEKGGSLEENKRGKSTKQKTGMDTKIGSSKEVALTASPKKKGDHKEKLDEEAKGGTSKDTATNASHKDGKDGSLVGSKRGKADKEKLDGDKGTVMPKETTAIANRDDGTLVVSKKGKADKEKLDGHIESVIPKEADADTQNGGILTKEGNNHKDEIDRDAIVTSIRREFVELQSLYPNLASFVNRIEVQHPCGSTFKRAFEFISDDKASTMESKIKKQKISEVKMQLRLADTRKDMVGLKIQVSEDLLLGRELRKMMRESGPLD